MKTKETPEELLAIEFAGIWHTLNGTFAELEAYKNTFTALVTEYPKIQEFLDARLASAKRDSALLAKTREKYALVLETCVRKLPDGLSQKIAERIATLESRG